MSSRPPRHIKVKEQIVQAISQEGFLDNGRLPTEPELANIFQVSRTTVRSALQSLEDDGIIVKMHGIGNFIQTLDKKTGRFYNLGYLNFEMSETPVMTVCHLKKTTLSAAVAKQLDTESGAIAYEVSKVMQCKGENSAFMREIFPASLFRQIPREQDIPDTIHDFFRLFYHRNSAKILTRILPVPADEIPFPAF